MVRFVGPLVLAGAALGVSCCSKGDPQAGPPLPLAPIELPSYAAAAAAYNARVADLERVHSRATVLFDGRDAEGKRLREKAEGYLLVAGDDQIALLIGKLGDTHLYLGANPARYWWLDMIDSGDKRAWVGRHEAFTPEKAAALGLPVHPLDLVQLLGVRPLPAAGGLVEREQGTGMLRLEPEGGAGPRVMVVDAATFEPLWIELRDGSGRPMALARLADYEPIRGGSAAGSGEGSTIATRVTVTAPTFDGEIRLTLERPENKPIRPQVFDAEGLIERFRIENVTDLDKPGVGA